MASASVASSDNLTISDYYSELNGPAKARYREKIKLVGFDPYALKNSECSDDIANFPAVSYPDIVNYLVIQSSWATGSEMKAWKAMDAYNFFVSGWVKNILTKEAGPDKVVVTTRVNHSQRARVSPLKTWIMADKNGDICLAHCDCMAGLCEACSHVGALLFALEAGVRMRDSCTQEKGRWLMPAYVKEIPYKPVCEMNLSSAKLRQRSIGLTTAGAPDKNRKDVAAPTLQEMNDFFKDISECGVKPAVLSLVKPYNQQFVPKQDSTVPTPLTKLFTDENKELEFSDLLDKCQETLNELTISSQEAEAIETATQAQSASRVWFEQRAGRITASKFKAACSTNPEKPSKSLVKVICYPEAHRFSNPATKWGIDKENIAKEQYQFSVAGDHLNLSVAECGLHINEKWPYIGASPDGLVFCECCGNGICEIKCPHKHRHATINEALSSDPKFCLKLDATGTAHLDKKHTYYFQVQCQLFVTGVEYCDFVVWTTNDIFIERIVPDASLWETNIEKATNFFLKGILPELLGKWYSRVLVADQSTELSLSESEDDGSWCLCKQAIEGSCLIGCDNDSCPVQWFHLSCVGLSVPPTGKWYCTACLNQSGD